MATPKLKLVPPEREPRSARYSTESGDFSAPWKQEFRGLSQLTSTLTGLLLGAILLGGFLYAYNLIQQVSSGKGGSQPVGSSSQEYASLMNVNIHSKPGANKNTRIGVCNQGARIQVVGTQVISGKVWYEIKLLSEHPKKLDSAPHLWVAAEYFTMLRQ